MAFDTKCPLPDVDTLNALFRYDGVDLYWRVGRRRGKIAGGPNGAYRNVFINKVGRFYVHRIIWAMWYGEDPGDRQIDHINRNGRDNRIANLRLTDHCGQQQNRVMYPGHTSRHRGVRCVPLKDGTPRWLAGIRPPRQTPLHLGTFDTEKEAAEAYNIAAKRLHGEFAVLNDTTNR